MNGHEEPRVLLLADSYWPVVGGGESHSRLLAATLHRAGVGVSVLTQQRFSDSPAHEQVDGVSVHRVGRAGLKRFGKYLMVPAMLRWMRAHRDDFDVVYVCGLRVLGAPATRVCSRLGKPVVLRSESCEELSGAYMYDHLRGIGRLGAPLVRAGIGWRNRQMLDADAFLAISTAIADEFVAAGVDPGKIELVGNGVDLSIYRDADPGADRTALRTRLGLPVDRVLMTYTGKLNRGKGLEYLLAAFALLKDDFPTLHLVLVGSGDNMYLSCESELREQIARSGLGDRVSLTGYRDDVSDFLRASDLFVMPSEMEALCISLIEALACALPAVASGVGGIPDVARDGLDALLVPPADAAALAQAIATLLADPATAARLGRSGQRRMHRHFGVDGVAGRHRELFARLWTDNGPTPSRLPDRNDVAGDHRA